MSFLVGLLFVLLGLCGALLILVVLIQRGKGGGLAGAFGGMGGHSAFGTRAGDKLMRITIGIAGVWIVLAMLAAGLADRGTESTAFTGGAGSDAKEEAADSDELSDGLNLGDSSEPKGALSEPPAETEMTEPSTGAKSADTPALSEPSANVPTAEQEATPEQPAAPEADNGKAPE